ncbi:MAG: nucleoside diphosphate kinase regulator [Dissulfurispiraceae bacterium]|jgi:regulator of nucleoside diphosphate kinase|nr:nucleoside diphosphate kinase regulator [Dissulfurispiraceae bacterium]
MKQREIFITQFDEQRLGELIDAIESVDNHGRHDLTILKEELESAIIVDSKDIPSHVVTMNSKVHLKDIDTADEMTYTLVFPKNANIKEGAISILAPIGAAILGYKEGDVVEWKVPSGIRKILIEKVIYQPEAAGDFHL